jgi:hypothetical protein
MLMVRTVVFPENGVQSCTLLPPFRLNAYFNKMEAKPWKTPPMLRDMRTQNITFDIITTARTSHFQCFLKTSPNEEHSFRVT